MQARNTHRLLLGAGKASLAKTNRSSDSNTWFTGLPSHRSVVCAYHLYVEVATANTVNRWWVESVVLPCGATEPWALCPIPSHPCWREI